jgi:hypothetical protein
MEKFNEGYRDEPFAEMAFSEILDIDILDSPSSPYLPHLSDPCSIFIRRVQIET